MIGGRALTLVFAVSCVALASGEIGAQPKPAPELDYAYYKARVEPIFLKKKDGHTRCVVTGAPDSLPVLG